MHVNRSGTDIMNVVFVGPLPIAHVCRVGVRRSVCCDQCAAISVRRSVCCDQCAAISVLRLSSCIAALNRGDGFMTAPFAHLGCFINFN